MTAICDQVTEWDGIDRFDFERTEEEENKFKELKENISKLSAYYPEKITLIQFNLGRNRMIGTTIDNEKIDFKWWSVLDFTKLLHYIYQLKSQSHG